MIYNYKNYIPDHEITVFTATIVYKYVMGDTPVYCDVALTDKKLIFAGEDILDIIPLNKIYKIFYSFSYSKRIVTLHHGANQICYIYELTKETDVLVQEIAKRIGY